MLRLLIEIFICATENEEQEKAIVLSEGASFEKKKLLGLLKSNWEHAERTVRILDPINNKKVTNRCWNWRSTWN